jgi:uncharacterized membrane protein (DUF373 family)
LWASFSRSSILWPRISLFQLIRAVLILLAGEAFHRLDQATFQGLFGIIMTLLIAMEFNTPSFASPCAETASFQVKTVVLIALIAVSRKFVILDTATTEATKIAALAAALLALGEGYWVLREREQWPLELTSEAHLTRNGRREDRP